MAEKKTRATKACLRASTTTGARSSGSQGLGVLPADPLQKHGFSIITADAHVSKGKLCLG